jgi:MFS family permease
MSRALHRVSRFQPTEFCGRAAVGIVAAMIAVLFAGSTVVTPLYVIYQRQFGFSGLTLTLIYAVYVVGNLAALLLFGPVSDRLGRRRTALPALAVGLLSTLTFLFAQSTGLLFLARMLSGLAIGVGAGTGTAWLAELIADEDKSRATTIATAGNFFGLAMGGLLAGVLAQYAPWPLRLPFLCYLPALLAVVALIWFTQETVAQPVPGLTEATMRPRLSIPQDIRSQFVPPAVAGFGALALVGFYAALAPTVLAQQLHETNHAVAGALLFELAIVVCGSIVAARTVSSRSAMLWALALMLPSVVLLVWAQIVGSMIVMITATAVCGVAAGLGYTGSLQVVNQIAPQDRRAEVVSAYFICVFCGNALPVVGIGVLAALAGPNTGSLAFAGLIIAFAAAALSLGVRSTRNSHACRQSR